MAEGFGRKYGIDCQSAGTYPSGEINPVVVQVMREKGIDLAENNPKMATVEMIRDADRVIVMGCSVEEACPRPIAAEMSKKIEDWGIEDPKGKSLETVRKIRDLIEYKVRELVTG